VKLFFKNFKVRQVTNIQNIPTFITSTGADSSQFLFKIIPVSSSDGTPLYKIVPTGPAVNPAIQPRHPFPPTPAPVVHHQPQQQYYYPPAQPVQSQPQPVVSPQPLPPVHQSPATRTEQPRQQLPEVKPVQIESIVSTSRPLQAVTAVPAEPVSFPAVEERSEPLQVNESAQDKEVDQPQTIQVGGLSLRTYTNQHCAFSLAALTKQNHTYATS